MRSRANIKTHPIHPILVAFPIGFFIGALVFDVIGLIAGNDNFHSTAGYLDAAGVIGGVAAAIPGLIDYIFTVPPQSSGKKRAMQHGLLNFLNVVLFIVIWLLRRNAATSLYLITGLELLGVIVICITGWMGGTLVYRNQIGVDPRYANAGKWKEQVLKGTNGSQEAASAGELQPNQMKLLRAGDKRIVLARTEDRYVAFEDRCTHKGGSLAGGAMICGTVQCPWHGSHFDVVTGEVKAGPARQKISTYPVEERNGKIYVSL